jgi:methylase of polypeptide subunit release factors
MGLVRERQGLSQADALEALRVRLADAGYTTERIEETLGGGRISFSPVDVAVHVRRLPEDEPFSELVKLLLLGLPLAEADIEPALARLGWLEEADNGARATLKLVPHGDLLICSDRDADGPTGFDWVAGLHPPSGTLAKLTVRQPVQRALDVATGNGIQALLASRHSDEVVGTDVNPRALSFAALNARLNRVSNVEYRLGSYFEPVRGEGFDLITCNPPYVISPDASYAYRDSGLTGDAVSRKVVEEAPERLREGGFAHILISWAHPLDDPWGILESWVAGRGCDSWLLYFGSDDPVTHASEWLRPLAAEDPSRYRDALARWLDYLERLGIEAIAHGAVILRRRDGTRNWTRKDQVALDRLEQASDHVLRVFAGQDYLEAFDDERRLLDGRFAVVPSHHLEQTLVCREGRTETQSTVLALDEGLGFRTALDEHTARLLPLLDGRRLLGQVLAQRAAELGLGGEEARRYETAALPVVRRLVELGFLVPRTSGLTAAHGFVRIGASFGGRALPGSDGQEFS